MNTIVIIVSVVAFLAVDIALTFYKTKFNKKHTAEVNNLKAENEHLTNKVAFLESQVKDLTKEK